MPDWSNVQPTHGIESMTPWCSSSSSPAPVQLLLAPPANVQTSTLRHVAIHPSPIFGNWFSFLNGYSTLPRSKSSYYLGSSHSRIATSFILKTLTHFLLSSRQVWFKHSPRLVPKKLFQIATPDHRPQLHQPAYLRDASNLIPSASTTYADRPPWLTQVSCRPV